MLSADLLVAPFRPIDDLVGVELVEFDVDAVGAQGPRQREDAPAVRRRIVAVADEDPKWTRFHLHVTSVPILRFARLH